MNGTAAPLRSRKRHPGGRPDPPGAGAHDFPTLTVSASNRTNVYRHPAAGVGTR